MRDLLLPVEATAWPLAAYEAFNTPGEPTNHLASSFAKRAQECRFQQDEGRRAIVAAYPNATWTPSTHLIPHARTLVDAAGPTASLLLDPERPGSELLRWRWASVCLPPQLWVAAATDPDLPPRVGISLLQRAITPTHLLAHQHLHAGAVFPFEVLWSRLASNLDLTRMSEDGKAPRLSQPCAPLWRWVVRAMVARRWLGARLLGVPLCRSGDHALPRSILECALLELEQGRLTDVSLDDLHLPDVELARYARGTARSRSPRSEDDVWAADPLWRGHSCPEACLLHRGLLGWDDLGTDQTLFAQYLRVKVALFRHLRSDPAARGLPSFTETYARISHWKSDLDGASLGIGAHEPELPLGSIELRTTPSPAVDEILDLVAPRKEDRHTPFPERRAELEWGWVLHLIRHRGSLCEEGYYHRRYRDHLAGEHALKSTLEAWPHLLTVLRGLDLAGDETSGPLWLAVPTLHRLRRVSDRLTSRHPWLRPLGLTLHAGEDYHHLLSGLRAVHEPWAWGLMRAGDRLGHGLALAQESARWCARHEPVEVRRWDRLLDLLWLEAWGGALGVHSDKYEIARRNSEICDLASQIWGFAPKPAEIRAIYGLLGDPRTLDRLGLRSPSRPAGHQGADDLLVRLLYDQPVSQAAHERIPVSRAFEQRQLGPLQRAIRCLVAQSRVTVEANPSSNLLVAELDGLLDGPAWRLRPTDPARDDLVDLTLSADDPLSFSTRLADEYAYAWAGMVAGVHDGEGVGPRYATAWLEEAARASWRSRFTVQESRSIENLLPPGLGDRAWARPT